MVCLMLRNSHARTDLLISFFFVRTAGGEKMPRFSTLICLSLTSFFLVAAAAPLRAESLQADAIVASHNRIRRAVGVKPLHWSEELARKARRYIGQMKENGCRMQHNGPGENLYWASPLQTATGKNAFGMWKWRNAEQKIPAEKVVAAWASEKQWYTRATNTCEAPMGESCGHYTQIVWAATTALGCARAVCEDKSQVWLCLYSPAGNIIGQRPY